jgi:hypothetical protein
MYGVKGSGSRSCPYFLQVEGGRGFSHVVLLASTLILPIWVFISISLYIGGLFRFRWTSVGVVLVEQQLGIVSAIQRGTVEVHG